MFWRHGTTKPICIRVILVCATLISYVSAIGMNTSMFNCQLCQGYVYCATRFKSQFDDIACDYSQIGMKMSQAQILRADHKVTSDVLEQCAFPLPRVGGTSNYWIKRSSTTTRCFGHLLHKLASHYEVQMICYGGKYPYICEQDVGLDWKDVDGRLYRRTNVHHGLCAAEDACLSHGAELANLAGVNLTALVLELGLAADMPVSLWVNETGKGCKLPTSQALQFNTGAVPCYNITSTKQFLYGLCEKRFFNRRITTSSTTTKTTVTTKSWMSTQTTHQHYTSTVSMTKPPQTSSVTTAKPPQTSAVTIAKPPQTSAVTTAKPPQTSAVTTAQQPQTSYLTTANPPQISSVTTAKPSQTSSVTTAKPPRTSSVTTAKPSQTSSVTTARPPRTSSVTTAKPSQTSSVTTAKPSQTSSVTTARPPRTSTVSQLPHTQPVLATIAKTSQLQISAVKKASPTQASTVTQLQLQTISIAHTSGWIQYNHREFYVNRNQSNFTGATEACKSKMDASLLFFTDALQYLVMSETIRLTTGNFWVGVAVNDSHNECLQLRVGQNNAAHLSRADCLQMAASICSRTSNVSDVLENPVFVRLLADMKVDSSETQKSKRKLVSVYDKRTSATAVGSIGVIAVISVFTLIALLDLPRLKCRCSDSNNEWRS